MRFSYLILDSNFPVLSIEVKLTTIAKADANKNPTDLI